MQTLNFKLYEFIIENLQLNNYIFFDSISSSRYNFLMNDPLVRTI